MAFYLVTALPRPGSLDKLRGMLDSGEIRAMRPFGTALDFSLSNARIREDGRAAWEEEDHCTPPLAQERAAVLDDFFDDIRVEPVAPSFGWARLRKLDPLFPSLARR